jgi:hypothetical protein
MTSVDTEDRYRQLYLPVEINTINDYVQVYVSRRP